MSAAGLTARLRSVREARFSGLALIVLACLPAAFVAVGLVSDFVWRTRVFGSNPIKEAEHFLGLWTLRFLGVGSNKKAPAAAFLFFESTFSGVKMAACFSAAFP